ncbi:hypothetical protein [Gordonia sp. MP11Mi]|uniref:Uncharacterized protein n=1 Tax=Gordonia sp. MP11Mi TaxID=3022769 RepID=A0AA97GTS6_9ACTN
MVTTGTPGLDVAGLAVTVDAAAPSVVPVRAAYAALHDARFPVSAVTAVIHVGAGEADRSALGAVSEAVRDGLGATGCRHTFDVDGGAAGVVAALAVGASLLVDDGGVLITVAERDRTSASIVLAGGTQFAPATFEFDQAHSDARGPYVLRSTSPVRGLLDCRVAGRYDVVLVAAGEMSPTASVRCRLQRRS